ncbi:hypothetical protein [Eikenella sp. NML01-A-086]|nr:hypothetical protein [Eikenella sp. NML01-A-086]
MTAEQIYQQWHEAAQSRNTAALYHELPAVHKIKRAFCKVCPSPPHSKAT